MKTKRLISFVTIFTLLLSISLVAFGSMSSLGRNVYAAELTDQEKVEQEASQINLPSETIIDFPVTSISIYGSTFTWESSNPTVINVPVNGGWAKVTRPTNEDVTVTLTVTITLNEATTSKQFEILVPKGTTLTNTYSITYQLGNELAINHADNPNSYSVGKYPTLKAPTCGNLPFLGWYLDGRKVESIPNGTSGDIVLVAKWGADYISSLEIKTNPTKLTYNALENFDSTGMEVELVYASGKKELVTDYTVDKTTLHGDDTYVTVSHSGFSKNVLITVNKLDVDMSGVVFNNKTVKYNGLEQSIEATSLPEGVKVKGYTNGGTTVGTYEVEVEFELTAEAARDYNTPSKMKATLTIEKAPLTITANSITMKVGESLPAFSVSYFGFVNNETYTVLGGTLSFTCNATSSSPIGDYAITPKGLTSDNYEIRFVDGTLTISEGNYTIDATNTTVTYNGLKQMFNAVLKAGDVVISGIEFSYTFNGQVFDGAINAGTYSVVVSYDDAKYGRGSQTITFIIEKVTLDLSGITLEDQTFTYDGLEHSLSYQGTLPNGVTVQYDNNSLTNVGFETVTLIFVYDTTNYNEVTNLTATLTVEAKALEITMVDAIPVQSYTGSAIEPTLTITYNNMSLVKDVDYTAVYSNNTEKGQATVVITGLGNYSGSITVNFTIGDSSIEVVTQAREELINQLGQELNTLTVLPLNFTTSSNDTASLFWIPESTALSVSENGTITAIRGDSENQVVVWVLIVKDNSAEYASFIYTIPAKVTNKTEVDDVTDVEVSNIPNDANLNVTEVTDSTNLEDYQEKVIAITENANDTVLKAYDIKLLKGSVTVQPNGNATVKLPIPEGYDASTLRVYYVGETSAENMNATVDGNYLVFTTTHFSVYVIVGEVEQTTDSYDTLKYIGSATETLTSTTANDNYAEKLNLPTDKYTVNFVKGTTSSYTALRKEDDGTTHIRLYYHSSGEGNSMIIKCTENITAIKISYASTSTCNATVLVNGLEITETNGLFEINSTSVTIKNASTTKAQVHISSIEIYNKELTDAEKVAYDKAALSVESTVTEDFILPTVGTSGSSITWELLNGSAISLSGANAIVTRGETDATVTLKATIKSGDSQDSKEFEITVKAEVKEVIETLTVTEFLAKELSNSIYYQLTGVVTNIVNTKYGNFDLVDETGSVYVYGVLPTKGGTEGQFATLGVSEGDTITIIGLRAEFNSAPQVGSAYHVSHTAKVWTDAEKVAYDKEALTLSETVTADFTLPETGVKGSSITWEVLNSSTAITIENKTTAKVTRPAVGQADVTVTLKATIKSGDSEDLKELTVTVKAQTTVSTEEHVITFNTSDSDSNDEKTKTNFMDLIAGGSEFISSVTATSKVYQGMLGAKFGASKSAGTVTLELTQAVTKVVLKTEKWVNTTTGVVDVCTITVNGVESADGVYTFAEATNVITITTKASSKSRFYLESITLGESSN